MIRSIFCMESIDLAVLMLDTGQFNYRISVTEGSVAMSMHPSLKIASKIKVKRNVLKRFERVELLKKDGRWQEGDRGYGLPKTKPEA